MVNRIPAIAIFAAAMGCSSGAGPAEGTRSFRLGFSHVPPRLTVEAVLQTIEAWRPRGDVALVTQTIPWKTLLADTSARTHVKRELEQIVALYHSRGLPVIVQLDVTDGLARDREHPELLELGRSIAEPAVQAAYREYAMAVDTILHPEFLGLAMETNLVRAIAPAAVYDAVKTMTNAVATALLQRGTAAQLFVSVQVETAWGRLPQTGQYTGIARDRADFPFIQAIGLSSYPFLGGFAEPADVPVDYYDRVVSGPPGPLPGLVVEGGWSSESVTGVTSSPAKQAAWIRRQMELADRADLTAVTQITYADFDMSTFPVPPGSILPLFAHLGLVTIDFQPKPALVEWDLAFARRKR